METLWVGLALAAGSLQVVRNGASKTLIGTLSLQGVNLVRFLYALPFAAGAMLLLLLSGYGPGDPGTSGVALALAAGAAQMTGNGFMVALMGRKEFAVAVTLSKSEAVLAALIGAAFFAQSLDGTAWTAVLLATFGVLLASSEKALRGRPDPGVVAVGIASGTGYALSFLFAARALALHEGGHPAANVAQVLLIMLAFQVAALGGWLWFRNREDFREMGRKKKTVWTVGASGAAATMAWFGACLYAPVALVKTVGQVEFLIAAAVSWWLFRERPGRAGLLGMGLLLAGIVLLLLGEGG